ncbi:MAG TPA: hypothetical protein VIV06_10460 [Candidatus Limnocylindrales bacterium]
MFELGEQRVSMTLYTDAFVVQGVVRTRQRRIIDVLNHAEDEFIVLADVTVDEFGSRGQPLKADFAQVNLSAVLFAVADLPVDPVPELRTPKIPELALISVPPFKIVGRIHLLPERDMREALTELTGRFVPVTDARYWSDLVGEARQTATMIAVNHSRAQILAPFRELDPWAGLDRGAVHAEGAPPAAASSTEA